MPSLERFFNPQMRVFSANITSLPGARLYFFAAGSTTPKVTYADKQGTIPNANPVIAGATGTFPPIFLDGLYRVELRSAGNIVQPGWPIDNVGQDTPIVPYASWSEIITYAEFERVTDPLTGIVYRSKSDGNLGNAPATSPSDWEVVIDPVPSSFTSDADYLSWVDDGGQISLNVDPVALADNFISDAPWASFSNDGGKVSLDVDEAGLADALGDPVTIAAGGGFTGNISFAKIGKVVTVTGSILTHSSLTSVTSAVILPTGFRPSALISTVYASPNSENLVATLYIRNFGDFIIEYGNQSGGVGSARTNTYIGFAISYIAA